MQGTYASIHALYDSNLDLISASGPKIREGTRTGRAVAANSLNTLASNGSIDGKGGYPPLRCAFELVL